MIIPYPKQGQHVLIVGQTGSGKTVLAYDLVRRARYVAVLDIKRKLDWEGFRVFEDLDRLIHVVDSDPVKTPRFIYRPTFEDMEFGQYDKYYEWLYRRGNRLVYTDEAALVCKGDFVPKYMRALLMQGRELGISTYNATQRPVGIAQQMISEVWGVYSFPLLMKQDRQKLQDTFAYPVEFLARDLQHAFYCLRQEKAAGAFRLKYKGDN